MNPQSYFSCEHRNMINKDDNRESPAVLIMETSYLRTYFPFPLRFKKQITATRAGFRGYRTKNTIRQSSRNIENITSFSVLQVDQETEESLLPSIAYVDSERELDKR